MKTTPAERFAEEIEMVRRSRRHLDERRRRRGLDAALSRGIGEYLACLAAWSAGARLAACLKDSHAVGGRHVSAEELALWLQDDNAGCQTGLARLDDGGVLFWHTEEDTIGYFDRPRLASITVAGRWWHAFLYPYLMPGPAFGFSRGSFHAVDSLHVRRCRDDTGSLTCVASWLVWRLGGELPARTIIEALAPYLDGCAINVVQNRAGRVNASVHEFGGRHVQSRELPGSAGSLLFQANAVSDEASPLAGEQGLSKVERGRYRARSERTRQAVGRLAERDAASPYAILRLLASRRGGSYAYANEDVKAHCVGIADGDGWELYVAPGSASPGDRYLPQFQA
jgi:hypothetical protein